MDVHFWRPARLRDLLSIRNWADGRLGLRQAGAAGPPPAGSTRGESLGVLDLEAGGGRCAAGSYRLARRFLESAHDLLPAPPGVAVAGGSTIALTWGRVGRTLVLEFGGDGRAASEVVRCTMTGADGKSTTVAPSVDARYIFRNLFGWLADPSADPAERPTAETIAIEDPGEIEALPSDAEGEGVITVFAFKPQCERGWSFCRTAKECLGSLQEYLSGAEAGDVWEVKVAKRDGTVFEGLPDFDGW